MFFGFPRFGFARFAGETGTGTSVHCFQGWKPVSVPGSPVPGSPNEERNPQPRMIFPQLFEDLHRNSTTSDHLLLYGIRAILHTLDSATTERISSFKEET
jgi:hypothetical protein